MKLPKDRFAISKTGTGFASAKLSEVLPPVAKAPVVRMTNKYALLSESLLSGRAAT